MAKASILDPKVRAAKKKKQAIVLGVLFLAVVAFQGPRTMKMLHRSAPPDASATTPAPTTPAPTTPAAPVGGGTAQSVSASVGGDALVVNADLQPAPMEGQLQDLTLFSSKDPFIQKDTDVPAGASTSSAGGGGGSTSTGGGGSTSTGGGKAKSSGKGGTAASGDAKGGGAVTPTPTKPAEPAAPAPTSAVLSVNGVQETVNVKADFPAASPLFHLVSLTAKTAKISIAGGSLATGAPTVTLQLGKPTTLMNTADGTRYVIVLVSTAASAASTAASS